MTRLFPSNSVWILILYINWTFYILNIKLTLIFFLYLNPCCIQLNNVLQKFPKKSPKNPNIFKFQIMFRAVVLLNNIPIVMALNKTKIKLLKKNKEIVKISIATWDTWNCKIGCTVSAEKKFSGYIKQLMELELS